jgi:hypothetical protein
MPVLRASCAIDMRFSREKPRITSNPLASEVM